MLKRLSRLFQADFHAVLDQLEDPESQLRQSLREMEKEIRDAELYLQTLINENERLERQTKLCSSHLSKIEPQLDLCFKSNSQELARNLVRQRLDWQKQQQALEQQRQSNKEQQEELRSQLENFRQHYCELKQKAELLFEDDSLSVNSVHRSGNELHSFGIHSITEQEVELAWLAEQEKRKPERSSVAKGADNE